MYSHYIKWYQKMEDKTYRILFWSIIALTILAIIITIAIR